MLDLNVELKAKFNHIETHKKPFVQSFVAKKLTNLSTLSGMLLLILNFKTYFLGQVLIIIW